MNEKYRVILNRYADVCAVLPVVKRGIKLFEREIQRRAEEGTAKEKHLEDAVLSLKGEYRRLVQEGIMLKQKLLRVMSAEAIAQACRAYAEKCRANQRRHCGK